MSPGRTKLEEAAELLVAEVDRLLPRAKRSARNAASHLERSVESVLFNIGEAVVAFKPAIKITAYDVARREAGEVRAILRRLVIKRVFTSKEIQRAYNLASVVIGMLTRTIVGLEERPQ